LSGPAPSIFEPSYESHNLYAEAEQQMRDLHASKCTDAAARQRDADFWRELDERISDSSSSISSNSSSSSSSNAINGEAESDAEAEAYHNGSESSLAAVAAEEDPLWRFRHFLRLQRIIALPLSGRTRVEGVTRMSLGPLKDMDDGRRQVSWSITQLCCKLVDYSDGQLIL
jgi:hypothetical protein